MRAIHKAGAAVIIAALVNVVSCEVPPTNTGSNTNSTANANSTPSAPAPEAPNAAASNVAVTLPVLDAFLADEAFATELKTKLQLTEEQMAELKAISHEATARLRASGRERKDGSAGATPRNENAESQIKRIVGPEKANRLLALVAERWSGNDATARSLPSPPSSAPTDTRIVVNEPAFRMDLFQIGRLVKSYKIGIGYPEFPLPTGMRKADTIIFNPTWTPPDSPWIKDNKVEAGKTVDAGEKLNPLGVLKIPIGLPSLIHGGKQPTKIGNFASHGCVGLTDQQAKDFAKRLAQVTGAALTDQQIADYEKHRTDTKSVKLPSAVPVELRYETIVVEDGKLHIYRDVYNRDTNTEENLRRVLGEYGITPDQLNSEERAQTISALEQMAADISKDPARMDRTKSNSNVSRGAPSARATKIDRANSKRAALGEVTRAIKGSREMVIEIAALKGKGYPAAVDLDTGLRQQNENPGGSRAARKRKSSGRR